MVASAIFALVHAKAFRKLKLFRLVGIPVFLPLVCAAGEAADG
jgi:hypothetical protein